MAQYGFYFDSTRCTGCRTCEMACKDYRDLGTDVAFRRVYDFEDGSWQVAGDGTCTAEGCLAYHVSVSCNHCDDPACVQVCPTTAMRKDARTGLVSVDAGMCVGCGYCHMACPYNAPKVDRAKGHSVKCTGCAERVAEGKQPICVEACPLRALGFGNIEALREAAGMDATAGAAGMAAAAAIAPLPDASYTSPNLVIKACPGAQEPGSMTGFVANPLEVR